MGSCQQPQSKPIPNHIEDNRHPQDNSESENPQTEIDIQEVPRREVITCQAMLSPSDDTNTRSAATTAAPPGDGDTPDERHVTISPIDEVAYIRNNTRQRIMNNRDARGEERWHASIDALARRWKKSCASAAKAHDAAGYKARTRHIIFGLPAPVTALATAAVSALWESEDARYFVVTSTTIAAIFSAVHTFLDMGGRAQRHWDFSARYGGIASKIDYQLVRDVDFRRPADEFLAETRQEIGALNANAPQLPNPAGCCKSQCCGSGADGGADIDEDEVIDGVTAEDIAKFRRANEFSARV